MSNDANLVACGQEHEMKAVLSHFEKRGTNDNVEKMQAACKAWKADESYRPANRESFYRYLNDKGLLKGME